MANGNKLIDQKAIDTIIDSILKAIEIKLNKKTREIGGKDGKDGQDGQDGQDGKDAALPRMISFSLAVTGWLGTGPYICIINEDGVTDNTVIVECVLTEATRINQLSDIEWTTSTGKIALSTVLKPTGELSGYMILTEAE